MENQRSFETINGITVPAVTADEMREVDRIAIEETGLFYGRTGKLYLDDIGIPAAVYKQFFVELQKQHGRN
jgi:hypothetical protein